MATCEPIYREIVIKEIHIVDKNLSTLLCSIVHLMLFIFLINLQY